MLNQWLRSVQCDCLFLIWVSVDTRECHLLLSSPSSCPQTICNAESTTGPVGEVAEMVYISYYIENNLEAPWSTDLLPPPPSSHCHQGPFSSSTLSQDPPLLAPEACLPNFQTDPLYPSSLIWREQFLSAPASPSKFAYSNPYHVQQTTSSWMMRPTLIGRQQRLANKIVLYK